MIYTYIFLADIFFLYFITGQHVQVPFKRNMMRIMAGGISPQAYSPLNVLPLPRNHFKAISNFSQWEILSLTPNHAQRITMISRALKTIPIPTNGNVKLLILHSFRTQFRPDGVSFQKQLFIRWPFVPRRIFSTQLSNSKRLSHQITSFHEAPKTS